jgi:hypothetical protein
VHTDTSYESNKEADLAWKLQQEQVQSGQAIGIAQLRSGSIYIHRFELGIDSLFQRCFCHDQHPSGLSFTISTDDGR